MQRRGQTLRRNSHVQGQPAHDLCLDAFPLPHHHRQKEDEHTLLAEDSQVAAFSGSPTNAKLGPIIRQAETEAEAQLADEPKVEGFCHLLWATQKRILKEKYTIHWRTPDEMNPNTEFD